MHGPTQTAQQPKARIGNCEANNDGAVHRPFNSFDRKIGEYAKGKNRNITDEQAKNPVYAWLVLRTRGRGRQLFSFSTDWSIHHRILRRDCHQALNDAYLIGEAALNVLEPRGGREIIVVEEKRSHVSHEHMSFKQEVMCLGQLGIGK